MSFERPVGPAPEGMPMPASDAGGASGPKTTVEITAAMRLQILSTEHWSLLASRSLAWNESFSRAGMFLTTLTGSIVALAHAPATADPACSLGTRAAELNPAHLEQVEVVPPLQYRKFVGW